MSPCCAVWQDGGAYMVLRALVTLSFSIRPSPFLVFGSRGCVAAGTWPRASAWGWLPLITAPWPGAGMSVRRAEPAGARTQGPRTWSPQEWGRQRARTTPTPFPGITLCEVWHPHSLLPTLSAFMCRVSLLLVLFRNR